LSPGIVDLCNLVASFFFSVFVFIFAGVKFFFFILSGFMLYMSCLPCGDGIECNEKAPIEISATDNHREHNHESEACTPFCTCSCCAVSIFYSGFSKIQDVKFIWLLVINMISIVVLNIEVYYYIY